LNQIDFITLLSGNLEDEILSIAAVIWYIEINGIVTIGDLDLGGWSWVTVPLDLEVIPVWIPGGFFVFVIGMNIDN